MWRNREQSLKFQENRRGTLAFSREYDILMMVKDSQNSRRNDMRLSDSIETFIKTLLAEDEPEVELIGVEAAGLGIETGKHASAMALGEPGVLHGMRSYLLQDTDGNIQLAHSISAGLDYPGVGPEHAYLRDTGRAKYVAITDVEAMDALMELCKLEGIIPAIESAHAVAYAFKKAKEMTMDQSMVICLSGRGDKDVNTIADYLDGKGYLN
jgi:tryptophan synthase beta chain